MKTRRKPNKKQADIVLELFLMVGLDNICPMFNIYDVVTRVTWINTYNKLITNHSLQRQFVDALLHIYVWFTRYTSREQILHADFFVFDTVSHRLETFYATCLCETKIVLAVSKLSFINCNRCDIAKSQQVAINQAKQLTTKNERLVKRTKILRFAKPISVFCMDCI